MWFVVFGLCIALQFLTTTDAAPQVPCFYIFGDSLSDPGNNNLLNSHAKANYPPYGIDFPGGKATGRFCNGRVIVDVLAELLGFDGYIPPFSPKISKNNKGILQGTNYASGAAGLRDESGLAQGERYAMSKQLALHKISVGRVATTLKSVPAASQHLRKCLYYVSIGSNDYLNNYFMPESYATSKEYSPEEFAADLIERYSSHIKVLYNHGARKIAFVGLGQFGLSPYGINRFGKNARKLHDPVAIFNGKLRGLVDSLNKELPDATFTFINMTALASASPSSKASRIVVAPCCKIGKLNNMTCQPFDKNNVCQDRKKYPFFDNIHLSEAVNLLLGNAYYRAPPPAVYPYNIRDLAKL